MEVYTQCIRLKGRHTVDLDLVNSVGRARPIASARRKSAHAVALVGVLIDRQLLALGNGKGEGQQNKEPSKHVRVSR